MPLADTEYFVIQHNNMFIIRKAKSGVDVYCSEMLMKNFTFIFKCSLVNT